MGFSLRIAGNVVQAKHKMADYLSKYTGVPNHAETPASAAFKNEFPFWGLQPDRLNYAQFQL